VHLVGFIIRIYHDALSPELQILEMYGCENKWLYVRPPHTISTLWYDLMQVFASRTATFYNILLKVHAIISLYVTVTLYVPSNVYLISGNDIF